MPSMSRSHNAEANTQSLYHRFGLSLDERKAKEMFKNQIKNLFIHTILGREVFFGTNADPKSGQSDIYWRLCNELSLEYSEYSAKYEPFVALFPAELLLPETFFRLQLMIDTLWVEGRHDRARQVAVNLVDRLGKIPFDLGIKIVIAKNRKPQMHPSASQVSTAIVEDLLGILQTPSTSAILDHFQAGYREYIFAGQTRDKLKDAVEDMTTACDVAVQNVLNTRSAGLKDLEKINLSDHERRVYIVMRDWMNKIKHDGIDAWGRQQVEDIIQLSALFIKTVLST